MYLQVSVSQQTSPRTGWLKGMTLITLGVILILALAMQFPPDAPASRQLVENAVFQSVSGQLSPRAVPVPTPPDTVPLAAPAAQPRFSVTPMPPVGQPRPQPVQTPHAAFGGVKALHSTTAGR